MTAPMATQPDVCRECNGARGFYSDNGPAPRWETCDYCEGAGDWDDIGYIEPVRSPVMMGASSFDGEIVSPAVAGELRSLGRLAA